MVLSRIAILIIIIGYGIAEQVLRFSAALSSIGVLAHIRTATGPFGCKTSQCYG